MCNRNKGNESSTASQTKEVEYHYPDQITVITS